MQKKTIATLMITLMLLVPAPVPAGDLDPPAAPDDPSSAMHTVNDLYERLDTGADRAKRTNGFTAPSGNPAATMRDIDDVMAAMPEADNITGATAADVAHGKTFWGLRTDGAWGLQTGDQCSGALSPGGRWCDRGDGTIKDMTTGLLWLKDASWGGQLPIKYDDHVQGSGTPDAHDRASWLNSERVATLSDGSKPGQWRLPTRAELATLITGDEPVICPTGTCDVNGFTGVQAGNYWSSSAYVREDAAVTLFRFQFFLDLPNRTFKDLNKSNQFWVWPVRDARD